MATAYLQMTAANCTSLGGAYRGTTLPHHVINCHFDLCGTDSAEFSGIVAAVPGRCGGDGDGVAASVRAYAAYCTALGGIAEKKVPPDEDLEPKPFDNKSSHQNQTNKQTHTQKNQRNNKQTIKQTNKQNKTKKTAVEIDAPFDRRCRNGSGRTAASTGVSVRSSTATRTPYRRRSGATRRWGRRTSTCRPPTARGSAAR